MKSVRRQFAVTIFILISGILALCWIANAIFLGSFYRMQKEWSLKDIYYFVEESSISEEIGTEEFLVDLQALCDMHNLSVLIVDAKGQSVISSALDFDTLSTRLTRYFVSGEGEVFIEGEEVYLVAELRQTGTAQIDVWGTLSNGYYFIFSIPMAAITETVSVSNTFLAVIGLTFIVISVTIIWFYTDRISKPILTLARISERMTQLDFEAKYEGDDKNELGILGNNINRLSRSLEKTISELKTANIGLERDIKKKEEEEAKRQEFMSSVSHELKTPIALIQGYAEGLRDGITDDPDSMEYYLDVIIDESEKMNKMVKSLMSLNELEDGSTAVNMERFNIVELVCNYIGNAEILIKEKDVKIDIIAPDALYVWGDEFKVEEVIMNYFTNAINHVKGEACKIVVTMFEENGKALVTVFNTGDPIPSESIGQVWDKFYKVDKARTREYGGSGVGLSIVRAIMESMNGTYGVRNVEGGVEFWFELELK